MGPADGSWSVTSCLQRESAATSGYSDTLARGTNVRSRNFQICDIFESSLDELIEGSFVEGVISSAMLVIILVGWFDRQNEDKNKFHQVELVSLSFFSTVGGSVKLNGISLTRTFGAVLPCNSGEDGCLFEGVSAVKFRRYLRTGYDGRMAGYYNRR